MWKHQVLGLLLSACANGIHWLDSQWILAGLTDVQQVSQSLQQIPSKLCTPKLQRQIKEAKKVQVLQSPSTHIKTFVSFRQFRQPLQPQATGAHWDVVGPSCGVTFRFD